MEEADLLADKVLFNINCESIIIIILMVDVVGDYDGRRSSDGDWHTDLAQESIWQVMYRIKFTEFSEFMMTFSI